MPTRVETTDPEGVDYGWVMQVTFVVTILLGAPVVALASTAVTLPTWGARVGFVLRVGAVVWIVVAVGVFLYAKRTDAGDGGDDPDEIESADDTGRESTDSESDVGSGTGDRETAAGESERHPDA
ncbi:DUF5822 domain-containing protein [Salinirubrum litoreum]|uniref:DUF5822 domain-containing protein n=1 Tax=Salinirubrum litoreum TaxID=1126234 RepID=A0ABD5R6X2_9EURY